METSAELLYLLKFYDKNDEFGFKDELERSSSGTAAALLI
jgi:glutathione S-transferase